MRGTIVTAKGAERLAEMPLSPVITNGYEISSIAKIAGFSAKLPVEAVRDC